jgi:hypothetical protein
MLNKLFTGLFVTAVILLTMSISKQVNALDDFDLMYYGPDVTVDIGRTDFIVKFEFYDDTESLNRAWARAVGEDYDPEEVGVRAFATSNPMSDVCFVHIVPAKFWDDREAMTILGHEVYHCALADHVMPETK